MSVETILWICIFTTGSLQGWMIARSGKSRLWKATIIGLIILTIGLSSTYATMKVHLENVVVPISTVEKIPQINQTAAKQGKDQSRIEREPDHSWMFVALPVQASEFTTPAEKVKKIVRPAKKVVKAKKRYKKKRYKAKKKKRYKAKKKRYKAKKKRKPVKRVTYRSNITSEGYR